MQKRAIAAATLVFLSLSGCAEMQSKPLLTLNQKANAAYAAGQMGPALNDYEALASRSPDDPKIWERLGNLYVLSKQPEKAIAAYRRAIEITPGNATVFYNMGVLRLRQAWAVLIQAYQSTAPGDPNKVLIEKLLDGMEKLPVLDIDGKAAASWRLSPPANASKSSTEKRVGAPRE